MPPLHLGQHQIADLSRRIKNLPDTGSYVYPCSCWRGKGMMQPHTRTGPWRSSCCRRVSWRSRCAPTPAHKDRLSCGCHALFWHERSVCMQHALLNLCANSCLAMLCSGVHRRCAGPLSSCRWPLSPVTCASIAVCAQPASQVAPIGSSRWRHWANRYATADVPEVGFPASCLACTAATFPPCRHACQPQYRCPGLCLPVPLHQSP